MELLSAITWGPDPEIFRIGNFAMRWYGLLFALGFVVGNYIMVRIYTRENKNLKDLDELLLFMVLSVVIGARLGHCIFYDPVYYFSNPIRILKIWEGGLASHGAAIAMLTALYIYARKHPDQPYFWVADRIAITAALGGAFIRFGNLMNSEIIGRATGSDWGVIFTRLGEDFPRHPTQVYESLTNLLTFVILLLTYNKYGAKTPHGLLTGLYLILVFSFRFLIEFFKENQEAWEQSLALNMGQLLSIPMILVGAWLLRQALSSKYPN
ncbi:MAG: prolipoprotein diacylglyceryl transferase [Bernardetiaceae bacterium]